VLEVDWPFFGELCRALALKIFREYDPEVVIGDRQGPASSPAPSWRASCSAIFASIAITRNAPGAAPAVIAGPPRLVTGKRVLIVDETCESGSTMKLAARRGARAEARRGEDGRVVQDRQYKPDFYALENENFIILPWDREVIIGGEIVVRPDYAEKLRELGPGV